MKPTTDNLPFSVDKPFFVYGTLRPGHGNARIYDRIAAATGDGQTWLYEHRLVTHGPFPYCIPAPAEQNAIPHVTVGALVTPEPGCYGEVMDRLDMLEGFPVHYDRRLVTVETLTGPVEAWVYIPSDIVKRANLPAVPGNDWNAYRAPMSFHWPDVDPEDDDQDEDDFDCWAVV